MRNVVVSGANSNTQARHTVCNECVYASAETHDLPVEWLNGDIEIGGREHRYFKTAMDYALTVGCGLQEAPEDTFWCDGYAGDYSCDCACN